VGEDDVEPGQALRPPDLLGNDLAEMGDELHLQLPDLAARVAEAEAKRRQPLLLAMECAVHRSGQAGDRPRDLVVFGLGDVEKRRVSLEVGEAKPRGGVDDSLEKPVGVLLRVREAHPVQLHELRVAPDVGQHEQCTHAFDPRLQGCSGGPTSKLTHRRWRPRARS
jgi:hypothetical protein